MEVSHDHRYSDAYLLEHPFSTWSEAVAAIPSEPSLAAPDEHPEVAPLATCCRVLIADDYKNSADMLARYLDLEGMTTTVVYDGAAALECARTFCPTIVCLDLGMPKVDGHEAARQLRDLYPDLLIIAISGRGSEVDMEKTRNAGFDAHLVKPVRPQQLRELMRDRRPDC